MDSQTIANRNADVFVTMPCTLNECEVCIENGKLIYAISSGKHGRLQECRNFEGENSKQAYQAFKSVIREICKANPYVIKNIYDTLSEGKAKDVIREVRDELFKALSF